MRTRPKAQCDQQRNGTRVCVCVCVCLRVCVCVPPFWLTLSCLVRRVVVVANAATAAHIHTHMHVCFVRKWEYDASAYCSLSIPLNASLHTLSLSLFHSTHHADTNTLKWRAQSNWKLSHSRLSFWFAFPPSPSPTTNLFKFNCSWNTFTIFYFILFFSSTNFTLHLSGTKTDLSRVPCQAVKLIAWIRLLLLLLLLLLAKWAPGLPTH